LKTALNFAQLFVKTKHCTGGAYSAPRPFYWILDKGM